MGKMKDMDRINLMEYFCSGYGNKMKKFRRLIVLFTIAASLLMIPVPVMAAGIDLSEMTDDEICELEAEIQKEFVVRNIQKTAEVPAGTYTTGKEFPAGSYDVTIPAGGSGDVLVYVLDETGKKDVKIWEYFTEEELSDQEKVLHIDLAENDMLQIDMAVTMKISKGVVFE